MKNILYLFSIIFLFEISISQEKEDSSANNKKTYDFFLNGAIAVGNPSGDFRKNVPDLSGGLSFDAIYFPINSIIGFGGHFDFLQYGSVDDKRPWSNSIPDVTLDVVRKNQMLHFQLVSRIRPLTKTFIPYLDIFLGGTNMFTSTEVRSEHLVGNNNDTRIAESDLSSDWTMSYGAGIGFDFFLLNVDGRTYDEMGNYKEVTSPLYFNFGYKYISSGEAKYLRPEDVTVNTQTGSIIMDFQKSRTDISVFQVGITLVF